MTKKRKPKRGKAGRSSRETLKAKRASTDASRNASVPKGEKRAASAERRTLADRVKASNVADRKAKHTSALTELAPIAKEINALLETAGDLDRKADDRRLTVAIALERARGVCRTSGLGFRRWVDDNVSQGYEECKKLVRIGAAPDPARALADMRAGAAKRSVQLRVRQKKEKVSRDAASFAAGARAVAESSKAMDPYDVAELAMSQLPDKHAHTLIDERAFSMGMRVVSEADVQVVRQAKKDKPDEFATVAEVKRGFSTLGAGDKEAVVRWAAALIGMTVSGDLRGDEVDITVPKRLRRTRGDGKGVTA